MDSYNENISKTLTLLSSMKHEIVTMQSNTFSMETLIANLFKYFSVLEKEIVILDGHCPGLQGKLEDITQSLTACKDLVQSFKSSGDVILRQADLVSESCLQAKREKKIHTSSGASSNAVNGFESLENSLTLKETVNINAASDSDDNEYESLDNVSCLDVTVKDEGDIDGHLALGNQSSEWLGNQSSEVLGNQSSDRASLLLNSERCDQIYESQLDLNTHLQSHSQDDNKDLLSSAHVDEKHKVGNYSCGQCNKAYRSKSGLEYHLKSSNSHKNEVKIEEKENVVALNDFKSAEESVSDDNAKEKSGNIAPTKEKLETDIIENKYDCNICGKGYKSRRALRYHKEKTKHVKEWKTNYKKLMETPTQNGDQQTTLADRHNQGKTTPSKSSKARRKGLKETPMSCEKCGREYCNPSSLRRHQKDGVCVRPLKSTDLCCHLCGKKCSTKTCLKIHIQNLHGNPVLETCEVCGIQVFKLKRHMAIHAEKQYSCPHCSKEFRWKSNLQRHMEYHSGIKPHMCQICGKAYTDKSCLDYHMAGHLNSPTQFKCDTCGKGFFHKSLLVKHEKQVHSSEAKFRCEVCLKSFKRNGSLQNHMVTHTGVKTHKCKICGEMFLHSSVLSRHLRKHMGLKPFVCPHCGKAFIDSWGRKQHVDRCLYGDRRCKEYRDSKAPSEATPSPVLPISPIACEPIIPVSLIACEPLVNMNL